MSDAPPDPSSLGSSSEVDEELEYEIAVEEHHDSGSSRLIPSWITRITRRVLPSAIQNELESKPIGELQKEALFLVRRTLLDTSNPKEDSGVGELASDLFRAARTGELANNILTLSEQFLDSHLPPTQPKEPSTALITSSSPTAATTTATGAQLGYRRAVQRLFRLTRVFSIRLQERTNSALVAFWANPPRQMIPVKNAFNKHVVPVQKRLTVANQRLAETGRVITTRVVQEIEELRLAVRRREGVKAVEEHLRLAMQTASTELENARVNLAQSESAVKLSMVKDNVLAELASLRSRLARGETLVEAQVAQAIEAVKLQMSRIFPDFAGDISLEIVLHYELEALRQAYAKDHGISNDIEGRLVNLQGRIRLEIDALDAGDTQSSIRSRLIQLRDLVDVELERLRGLLLEERKIIQTQLVETIAQANVELSAIEGHPKFKEGLQHALKSMEQVVQEGSYDPILTDLNAIRAMVHEEQARLANSKKEAAAQARARLKKLDDLMEAQIQRLAALPKNTSEILQSIMSRISAVVSTSRIRERLSSLSDMLSKEFQQVQAAYKRGEGNEMLKAQLVEGVKHISLETDELRILVQDNQVHLGGKLLEQVISLVESMMSQLKSFRQSVDENEGKLQEKFASFVNKLQVQVKALEDGSKAISLEI